MKFHAWILLLLSTILVSCSTFKNTNTEQSGTFTGQPLETSPQIPVAVEELPPGPELPTPVPTETDTQVAEIPSQGSEPIGPSYPIDNAKKVFTVRVEDKNYSKYAGAKEKLNQAEKVLVKIFNSKDYKDAVLNFKFKGETKFHDNKGLTNLEIYEKLFAGAESLMPAINYQMDLIIEMYYSKFVSTVGYTYPSDLVVHTNWKYHKNYGPCRIASNLAHEWTHKMGFGHDSKHNSSRPFSVPYAHNTIIEELCEKAEKGQLTELR